MSEAKWIRFSVYFHMTKPILRNVTHTGKYNLRDDVVIWECLGVCTGIVVF